MVRCGAAGGKEALQGRARGSRRRNSIGRWPRTLPALLLARRTWFDLWRRFRQVPGVEHVRELAEACGVEAALHRATCSRRSRRRRRAGATAAATATTAAGGHGIPSSSDAAAAPAAAATSASCAAAAAAARVCKAVLLSRGKDHLLEGWRPKRQGGQPRDGQVERHARLITWPERERVHELVNDAKSLLETELAP